MGKVFCQNLLKRLDRKKSPKFHKICGYKEKISCFFNPNDLFRPTPKGSKEEQPPLSNYMLPPHEPDSAVHSPIVTIVFLF